MRMMQLLLSWLLLVTWAAGLSVTTPSSVMTQAALRSDIRLVRVSKPEDIYNSAALCMEVFFNSQQEQKDQHQGLFLLRWITRPVRTAALQRLYRKLTVTMLAALDAPYRFMLQAVDPATGAVIGYIELYLSPTEIKVDETTKELKVTVPPAAGFSSSIKSSDVLPKIANLAVVPSARKRGIGTLLVARCIEAAQRWGFDEVQLTVEPENCSALDFYTKLGFVPFLSTTGKKWSVDSVVPREMEGEMTVMRKLLPPADVTQTPRWMD